MITMPRRFGLTAMLVGLLPVLASAHLEFFCASAVFSNSTQSVCPLLALFFPRRL